MATQQSSDPHEDSAHQRLFDELKLQAEENDRNLRELNSARKEVAELRAELDTVKNHLSQRESKLGESTQQLADLEAFYSKALQDAEAKVGKAGNAELIEFRQTSERNTATLQKRLDASEAACKAALAKVETWKAKAAAAERRSKEDARDTERELLEHQSVWRQKIAVAEQHAKEIESTAKEQVAAADAERDRAQAEVSRLQLQLEKITENEHASCQELQVTVDMSQTECQRLAENLKVSSEVEAQLRRELAGLEHNRTQLQDRCTDLSRELEQVQAAYSEAAQEIGAMSSRLHEIEFGSQAETNSEDLLRQQLNAAKDRCSELETRVNEITWMRDYALQQADEARLQLQSQREEMARLAEAQSDTAAHRNDSKAPDTSLRGVQEEVSHLQLQLQNLMAQHEEELDKRSQLHREEVQFLRQKLDEKDRRLEVLTCERNALRFETSEQQVKQSPTKSGRSRSGTVESLPDLEEGRGRTTLRPEEQGTTLGAVRVCAGDTDWLLQRFSRLLFASPIARRVFYGYLMVLHVWGWLLLHHAAAHHVPHGK